MKIITEILTLDELKKIAADTFGNMVKAVVDVDRELIAVDAELHSDLEALLLENGSKQKSLWGVDDEGIRKKIVEIALRRIKR